MNNLSAKGGGPFVDLGQRLITNGYQVVPLPIGSKGPRVPDWRNLRLSGATFHKFAQNHNEDGIGIVTARTPAVDIDSMYAPIVEAMKTWCFDNIGEAPVRVGKAPKALLLYSTSKPFPKVLSSMWLAPNDSKHRLEVLGDGQQFVAWHIHPETGRPYEWISTDSPLTLATLDLEEMTHEHALAAAREFDRLCAEQGFTKVGESKATSASSDADDDMWAVEAPPPESDAEIQRVRAALFGRTTDDKPYVDPDGSREDYLAVLAALKWTGWLCAEEIAREWASASDDKFDERDFARDWRSLKQSRGSRTTTLASIYGKAKAAGWDASRAPTEEQKAEEFERLLVLVEELDPTNRIARKQVITEIAEAKIDRMDLSDLVKALCKKMKASAKDVRSAIAEAKHSDKEEPTHGTYAKRLLTALEDESGVAPLGCEGNMWTYDQTDGIWVGKEPGAYEVDVQRRYDGEEGCKRRTDYLAIANHAFTIASTNKEKFFQEAPVGLACDGRFYSIEEGELSRVQLSSYHRQRVLANVVPRVMDTPKWDRLMAMAFEGDREREQELLLEEFFGAAIVGFANRFEKALFMYGKGRAGKGTILKIMSAILPASGQSSVPPDRWDREYYLADLAGKRMNIVGETSEERPIDSATFKSVLGRDMLTARQPTHRAFSFINTAAHAFNGNYFPTTRDHGAEFFSRWLLMEFRNSLIGKDDKINANLAQEIIDEELPGVVARLLHGAKRLLQRGRFEPTSVHHRLMAQWQHRSSSAVEFFADTDVVRLGDFRNVETTRLMVYQAYRQWCLDSGRKGMGKQKFYEEFEKAGIQSMGIRFATKSGGIVLVRGMALRSQLFDSEIEDDELRNQLPSGNLLRVSARRWT